MIVETFAVGPLACQCTIVADEESGEAIVIDGGDDAAAVAARLEKRKLRARLLVHTHAHIDHIGDLGSLRRLTGGLGLLHPADLPLYRDLGTQASWIGLPSAPTIVPLDGDLHDEQILRLGGIALHVLHTPGHTPGSVCFALTQQHAIERGAKTTLFTGDTLFAGSIGRWDLGGTSMEDIVGSINAKLMRYDDVTPVVPGHGPTTTIGIERRSNPYLR